MPEGNTLWPFLHKRSSFAHENEVRAVIHRPLDMRWITMPSTWIDLLVGGIARKSNQRLAKRVMLFDSVPCHQNLRECAHENKSWDDE
jgi:hypothetical protein